MDAKRVRTCHGVVASACGLPVPFAPFTMPAMRIVDPERAHLGGWPGLVKFRSQVAVESPVAAGPTRKDREASSALVR
jgi:hypothetical protein